MTCIEEAITFGCENDTLIGVLSLPADWQASDTALLIIVGGPQYRAGSHRQFTLLARRAAAAAFPTLRFDYRGMGDSTGEARAFEAVDPDIASAIDALQSRLPTVRRIVLWGLCDAASAALLYWQRTRDRRIAGMCLLNPWTRSPVTLARTQVKHYYVDRLMQREFWRKLLGGKLAARSLVEFANNLRLSRRRPGAAERGETGTSFQHRMASAWMGFEAPMLLMLSGMDYTAKEFLEHAAGDLRWAGCLGKANVTRVDSDEADHTFSEPAAMRAMEDSTIGWLRRCVAQAAS